jgi:hypothetical protein
MLIRTESLLCHLPLCLALFAGSALAQNNPELGDVNRNAPPPPTMTQVTTQPASRPAVRAATPSGTDHAMMVGHFGVGFLGVLSLPTMSCTNGMPTGGVCVPDVNATLSAPTIGARYWLDERMAIEAALGIGFSASGRTAQTGNTSVDTNNPHLFGLALHGGLPLVFATSQHFAFEVVPELNVGFVSGGWSGPTNDESLSGFLLELGGRVGAEIQFGFIDIPQLALQGSVGVHLRYEGRSQSGGATDTSSHNFNFGTTVQGNPWDIFTGNISAIYYF